MHHKWMTLISYYQIRINGNLSNRAINNIFDSNNFLEASPTNWNGHVVVVVIVVASVYFRNHTKINIWSTLILDLVLRITHRVITCTNGWRCCAYSLINSPSFSKNCCLTILMHFDKPLIVKLLLNGSSMATANVVL